MRAPLLLPVTKPISALPHPSRTHLSIVMANLDDLWSHPMWRPYERVPLAHGVCQLSGNPKIRQLHFAILRQKYVATLDVPMHLPTR